MEDIFALFFVIASIIAGVIAGANQKRKNSNRRVPKKANPTFSNWQDFGMPAYPSSPIQKVAPNASAAVEDRACTHTLDDKDRGVQEGANNTSAYTPIMVSVKSIDTNMTIDSVSSEGTVSRRKSVRNLGFELPLDGNAVVRGMIYSEILGKPKSLSR